MEFKNINRDFVLSDDSVNVYGFKLLTSGCDLDEFKKIPIGFYDHNQEDGVMVRWADLRIENNRLMGKPKINLNHPRGIRTCEEIENGFVNSASVGKLVTLEMGTEIIDGEEVQVFTKWYPREISIVGLPGNRNAIMQVYDELGQEIQLSDISNSLNSSKVKQSHDYNRYSSKSLSDLMEQGLADQCLEKYPSLLREKWIAEYGLRSWEQSFYIR